MTLICFSETFRMMLKSDFKKSIAINYYSRLLTIN